MFDRIVGEHPELSQPTLKFYFGAPAGAAYDILDNQIQIDPFLWAREHFTEADVKFLVAHELGHWHMYKALPDEAERARDAQTTFRFLRQFGIETKSYRELPGERYADEFAFKVLGEPFNIADLEQRYRLAA
jgi:predicted SprT family Zn-dependent metalloprotease